MTPPVKQQPYSPAQPHFVSFMPSSIQDNIVSTASPLHPSVAQDGTTVQNAFRHCVPILNSSLSHAPQDSLLATHIVGPPSSPAAVVQAQTEPNVQVTISEAYPAQSRSFPEVTSPPSQTLLRSIAFTLHESRPRPADVPKVTSLDDLNKAFEPYERIMEDLLEKSRTGTYTSLGLEPSIVPEFEIEADKQMA
jgi:hypothetical protein